MAFSLKYPQQFWVAIVAFRGIEERLDETTRRIFRGWQVQVETESGEDLSGIPFEFEILFVADLSPLQFHGRKVFIIIGIIMDLHSFFPVSSKYFEGFDLPGNFLN